VRQVSKRAAVSAKGVRDAGQRDIAKLCLM